MIDETICWTLYQLRNWSNWSRPMRLAITILPMVIFGIVFYKAFFWKREYEAYAIVYRDLRWLMILLLPWAFSQIVGLIYFSLCYSP